MTDDAYANPFSDRECRAVARIAGLVIPASAEHGVPGADNPAVVAEILRAAAPHHAELSGALSAFAGMAEAPIPDGGTAFRAAYPDAAQTLQALVVQCYYRDDRVVRSLGMEPRPPFPEGFAVEQGDWSLLDRVRARPPIYREAQ